MVLGNWMATYQKEKKKRKETRPLSHTIQKH